MSELHRINLAAWKLNPRNCPVREFTADKRPVGTCTFYLTDGKICPRHGDILKSVDAEIRLASALTES